MSGGLLVERYINFIKFSTSLRRQSRDASSRSSNAPQIFEGEILERDADVEPERQKASTFASIDIGATISNAP